MDHSDNHQRLGFVTDIDESYTGLHVGKTPAHENRTQGIRLPKECFACAYLKPPRMACCPACGYTAQPQNDVKPVAGELRELKPKPKVKKTKGETAAPVTQQDKTVFYAELMGHAALRGYKDAWAANQYKARTGVWPAHTMRYVTPIPPGPATADWIKSRQIAWARRRDDRGMSHEAGG